MTNQKELNLVELEFRRDENKFFVPPSFAEAAVTKIESICLENSCIEEKHEHPITRSAYYYLGDTDSMPPGFSVRYREYVDNAITDNGSLGESPSGFYEIKWFDKYESGRPVKRKIRLQGQYSDNIIFDDLHKMVAQLDDENRLADGVLESLDTHIESIRQDGFDKLYPLFIAEYVRNRFVHEVADKKNIISVDQNVRFYDKTGDKIQDLGQIEGCIVEYKESADDTKLRWQLYRSLVDSNATRFYGKKGEALNLLQRQRSKNAPPIRNELEGYEVEGKLGILTDIQQASRLVSQLYRYFDQEDKAFIITPGFRTTNSQSTMGTYVVDPHNPDVEGKMLVGLDAKYSTKSAMLADSNGIIVRKEVKGERFEYNRQQAKNAMSGMEIAGKTQRIRRAFYLISRSTARVYKVSIDFNWKLPIQDNDFFSQLEVEYTGIPTTDFHGTVEPGSDTFTAIKAETGLLMNDIKAHLDRIGVPFAKGQRKVDMLAT